MSDATGVSRRDFLKRGAALGGAIAWATPVVQTIGMRAAFAQTASPACTVWYAAKIQRIGDTQAAVTLNRHRLIASRSAIAPSPGSSPRHTSPRWPGPTG
jgi:hypothetical protein